MAPEQSEPAQSEPESAQYGRVVEAMRDVRERDHRSIADASSPSRPTLVLVYSERSGPSRKAEAFLAQVLQRRRNHDTFRLVRLNAEKQPRLVEHLRVTALPTLLVVDSRKVRARIEVPRGRAEIETALAPWLR